MSSLVEITHAGGTVRIGGGSGALDGLDLSDEGVRGWFSTPECKTSPSERVAGHGAHDVAAGRILYAARVVTLDLYATAPTREGVAAHMAALSAAAGSHVAMRYSDGASDTYCEGGYLTATWDPEPCDLVRHGSAVLVFPRPERLSAASRTGHMSPSAGGGTGLRWSRSGGILIPLEYGEWDGSANACTVANDGTHEAFPVIRASNVEGLVVTDATTGGQLAYPLPIGDVPVVFDCRSRTASCNGVDVTRNLSSRSFPTVPPKGSLTLSASGTGPGTVEVESHDTYI